MLADEYGIKFLETVSWMDILNSLNPDSSQTMHHHDATNSAECKAEINRVMYESIHSKKSGQQMCSTSLCTIIKLSHELSNVEKKKKLSELSAYLSQHLLLISISFSEQSVI
uniref:Uncharacterized protein n=1 Tax=Ananas comosus var. bracteatus TaxID=296719 RepID=A0A6V7NII2_ANACO|nr:unnamed protein product [Ananas comosus var. bracteatus]